MKPLPLDDKTLSVVPESLQSALGLVLVIVPENLLQLCLELYIRHIPFEFIGGGRERVLQRFQHRPLDMGCFVFSSTRTAVNSLDNFPISVYSTFSLSPILYA